MRDLKKDKERRCDYVLSESFGYRCTLPAGHTGSHHIEASERKRASDPPPPEGASAH